MKSNTDSITQLTLLPTASVPAQFRLSEATRRRGRHHIAEIRAHLAARQTEHEATLHRLPNRPQHDDLRPSAA